jgi:hypothetical protein
MKKLDREELGQRQFWREFKEANQNREKVYIITHRKSVDSLQKDLKLLLGRTVKNQGRGAVNGLTPDQILIILEIIQWVIILTLSGVVIYLVSKRYKFKITKDKDGNIIIEGEPA